MKTYNKPILHGLKSHITIFNEFISICAFSFTDSQTLPHRQSIVRFEMPRSVNLNLIVNQHQPQ